MSGTKKEYVTMSSSTEYLTEAKQLLKLNEDQPDTLTCLGVKCGGVACRRCPLTPPSEPRRSRAERLTYLTLGEVRGAVDQLDTTKPEIKEKSDVTHPNHYMLFDNMEAIEVIARSMTVEQFKGYVLGNILKYRLRAGKKTELATMEKDLKKAAFYQELFDKYKGLCHVAS